MWHEKSSGNKYFHLFLKTAPSHSSICSISWSWLLCSVFPTCSCFKVSPQGDSLTPLPSSWPPASFRVVCLLPCKFGWAAGEGRSLVRRGQGPRVRGGLASPWAAPCSLQATSCAGSILRVPCPCYGADQPEATSGHSDTWKL